MYYIYITSCFWNSLPEVTGVQGGSTAMWNEVQGFCSSKGNTEVKLKIGQLKIYYMSTSLVYEPET